MWETLQNNADWDCFKTPILQETWKTNPTIRRGLPPGLPAPQRVGRSVSGNIGCARPPTNLVLHVPTGRAGNSDLLPISSLRRQRGHGSTVSNAGCYSEKGSLVASKKYAPVRAQQSNRSGLRKTASGSAITARRRRKTPSTTFDKSCLERATLCIEHVKNYYCCPKRSPRRLQRLSPACKGFVPFGGTHLDVTLRTFLQEEQKLLGPPRLKGSEPQAWDTILTYNI